MNDDSKIKDREAALKILNKHKDLVWPEIKKYFTDPELPKQFKIPSNFNYLVDFHWEIVSEYPKRQGKYLRPTLLMLTGKAMGTNDDDLLKTAAAMQTSEDWILNHDDVEDNSPLRRGKPTLHKIYGDELAINAGDALHTLMWKMLIDNLNVLGKDKTLEIMDEFFKIIFRTTLGQTIDIKWFKENKKSINEQEWNLIADSKSAYYSIAAPIRLGAIIANANNGQLNSLTDFGLNLGRAFQLVDDILDVTSDFKGLKQRGNDIYEGKRTLIVGHLLDKADTNNKKKILNILDKDRDKKTEDEIEWVILQMEKSGSIIYAKKLVDTYKKKFNNKYEDELQFLKIQPYRDQLRSISSFIINRDH